MEPDMTKPCNCGHPAPGEKTGHALDCRVWRHLTGVPGKRPNTMRVCDCGSDNRDATWAHTLDCAVWWDAIRELRMDVQRAASENKTWKTSGIPAGAQAIIRVYIGTQPRGVTARAVAVLDQLSALEPAEEPERTTKVVTAVLTLTFHGDYWGKDEVATAAEVWLDGAFEDRDDLRSWRFDVARVDEIKGDPEGFDR